MGNTPADKNIAAAKEHLINVKPGEPGFVRPRVPSDPDFAAFLTSRGFYPLFSADTKRRLLKHLRHLDSSRNPLAEVDALERLAALTQYRYVHYNKRRLSVAERDKLSRDFVGEAERFRTALDKLQFFRIIRDPNNVEAPLPDGSGFHVLRHSLRDLQAAIDDLELQVAAALGPDQEDEFWQSDPRKPGNAENIARSEFIDICIRVWLRNGGSDILTYRVKSLPHEADNRKVEYDTGLLPFVRDATSDTFTGEYLTPVTADGLSQHLTRGRERILHQTPEEAWLRTDPAISEWGAPMRGDRPGAAKASLEDAVARSALRMVLNTLKKRWSKMTGHRAD